MGLYEDQAKMEEIYAAGRERRRQEAEAEAMRGLEVDPQIAQAEAANIAQQEALQMAAVNPAYTVEPEVEVEEEEAPSPIIKEQQAQAVNQIPSAPSPAAPAPAPAADPYDIFENPQVKEYMRQKQQSASNVADAENTRDMVGYGNIAGNLLNDYNNSQRGGDDVILDNRLQDLGRAPTVKSGAEQDRKYNDYGSGKLAQQGVSDSKSKAKQDIADWKAQKGVEQYAGSNDSASPQSEAARNMLQELVPRAAKMKGFEDMSEAQVNKYLPTLMKRKTAATKKTDMSPKDKAKLSLQFKEKYTKDTKDYNKDLDVSDKMDQFIVGAQEGNQESVAQLRYLAARLTNGPGVLTDNDLKNAGVNQSVVDKFKSWVTTGAAGELTQDEIEAFRRIGNASRTRANSNIKEMKNNYSSFAKEYDLDERIIYSGQRELKESKPNVPTTRKKMPNGKIALFNTNTREFIKYEGE